MLGGISFGEVLGIVGFTWLIIVALIVALLRWAGKGD